MSDFAPPMNIEATRIGITRNAANDKVYQSYEVVKCHFREINRYEAGVATNNREETRSDAFAWFAADEPCDEGSIYKIEGQYYRAIRVTKARRLGESDIQFIKAELEKFEAISS